MACTNMCLRIRATSWTRSSGLACMLDFISIIRWKPAAHWDRPSQQEWCEITFALATTARTRYGIAQLSSSKRSKGVGIAMATAMFDRVQNCEVNVFINKGMALPIGMLPDAVAKAAAMFREVGVDLRILKREPHSSDGACGMPIVIEFENAHFWTGTARVMAYARPYQSVGTSVHVFIDR